MTRSFYSAAITFIGIYVALALFQSILFLHLGAAIYDVPSVARWLIFLYVVGFIWSILMLTYYHAKGYLLAFWTCAASTGTSVIQFYLFYNLLISRQLSPSYVIATVSLMATGISYALALIFSQAGRRQWLKIAGVAQLFLGALMLTSFVWAIASVSARVNGTIVMLEQCISVIGSLSPLLFVFNFMSERAAATDTGEVHAGNWEHAVGIAAIFAFAAACYFVPPFAVESLRSPDDPALIGEGLKRVAEPFEARTFAGSHGKSLPYRLMKPLDYDSTRQYPLVVCLHGSSAVGADNVKQVAATLPARLLSTAENRKKYPAFLFVPQCPRGFGWGGLPEHPAVDSLVFEAIAALEKEFPIDSKRRYVAGYSMGGYGAWHFIAARPEVFAAAVPMCGGGDPASARNIVGIPVWAFHGAKDMNVPVTETRQIIEALRQAGGHPRYTEFPDAAHNIWPEVTQTTELPEWLFAQKRE
ncbi:MAG TPA: dienelactone hydrolase family protein [Chryseosolibacter sp.]